MSSPRHAAAAAARIFGCGAAAAVLVMPLAQAHVAALGGVAAVDLLVAALARLLPWDRWPRAASLSLVAPAWGVVAYANAQGLLPPRGIAVLYVLAFVWVGAYHRRGAALVLAPLAAASYAGTIRLHDAGVPVDAGVVVMVVGGSVLVAEVIARSHARLRASEQELRFLVDHMTDFVTRVGSDGVIRYVSPSCEQVLGWRPEEMVGTYAPAYRHPDDDVPAEHARANPGKPVVVVRRLRRKDGGWTWLESVARAITAPDGTQEIVSTARDVTERRLLEAELARVASHDELTGLLNRRVLERRLGERLAGSEEGRVAVAFIDLDGFKQVNDEHGHRAGDELLTLVAARLRHATRDGDVVARYGGDEFVVVLDRLAHEEDVAALAARFEAELARPYLLGSARVQVGASVGVSIAVPGTTLDDLVREADDSMYAVKAARRPTVPAQRG